MNISMLLRLGVALALSINFTLFVYYGNKREASSDGQEQSQRYRPYFQTILPTFLLISLSINLLLSPTAADAERSLYQIFSTCFDLFLPLSLYYVLLLPALPWLRNHISARTCAALWMLPNYLYLALLPTLALPMPRWVLTVPGNLLRFVAVLWLTGFLLILLGSVLSHLHFRHTFLSAAEPVTDPATLELWNQAQQEVGILNCRLVRSSVVETPLSIGFFRRTTRVVLPQRVYTPEELSLIFRHELIHISREDSSNKFFLVFCSAMCWFNPLMWIAMRRSADDLELSCDETVLLQASQETRIQYANLLLRTAGNPRGFTTCLSASASALRYRLKNVTKPRDRHTGSLLVGVVFLLLFLSCGQVALAHDPSTGAEYIFDGQDPAAYTFRIINRRENGVSQGYDCPDPDALRAYLAQLPLEKINGNFDFSNEEAPMLFLYCDTPQGSVAVTFEGRFLTVSPLYDSVSNLRYYYLPEPLPWEEMMQLLTPHT